MNGVQLTFFNFAGHLVPGIIGLLLLLPLFFSTAPSLPETDLLVSVFVGKDGSVRGSVLAAAVVPALAVAFLLGVMISDTAVMLASLIRARGWLFYRRANDPLFGDLIKQERTNVAVRNAEIRQALALEATTGWDLYGSAARARMCNASGFIISISAFLYACFSPHLLLSLFLGVLGSYLIVLGLKLHAEYWDFVDTVAYLRVTSGREASED